MIKNLDENIGNLEKINNAKIEYNGVVINSLELYEIKQVILKLENHFFKNGINKFLFNEFIKLLNYQCNKIHEIEHNTYIKI